jgi:hypothetical protein
VPLQEGVSARRQRRLELALPALPDERLDLRGAARGARRPLPTDLERAGRRAAERGRARGLALVEGVHPHGVRGSPLRGERATKTVRRTCGGANMR